MDESSTKNFRQNVSLSLSGRVQPYPPLHLDPEYRVISLRYVRRTQVSLISGGGTNHEPAHAEMVGEGLLSTAATGNLFVTASGKAQVPGRFPLVEKDKGTLFVMPRYTGDVLLYGRAREQHGISHPNSPVELVLIGDDAAVPRARGKLVGRRGLAGTILAYTCAAAAAAEGRDLGECKIVAEAVARMLGTIGAGLSYCDVPGTATQESYLHADQVEIGMGIYSGSGIKKQKLPRPRQLVTEMLSYITNTSDIKRTFLPFKHDCKDKVVLMVNNLGGIGELEMTLLAREALGVLDEQGIEVVRAHVGSFMTSCNLPGFSLTLLLLPRAEDEPEYSPERILRLLDAPAWASALKPL